LSDYLYQDSSLDPYEYVCNVMVWKPLRRQRWKDRIMLKLITEKEDMDGIKRLQNCGQ